jgi:lipopolysaccharide transport system ATP-binding protein
MTVVIKVENLSKQYRLGVVGTGTISHDLNRAWYKMRGLEDPYLKIEESADKRCSDYFWALKDLDFEVKQGEILGVVGKNGAGKSTLLKIMSKITSPSTGSIKIKGRINALLEVGTGFHPELTGKENIYLNGAIQGMTKKEITSKFDEIVEFSGVSKYLDTPVKRYSSGMKVRLGFSVAAHLEPEILIVDEVLAVGDIEFQKKCLGKMQDVSMSGRTILFVSHSLAAIRKLTTKCILMENGRITANGDTKSVLDLYMQTESEKSTLDFTFRQGLGQLSCTKFVINNGDDILCGKPFSVEVDFKNDGSETHNKVRVCVGFDTADGERVVLLDSNMKGELLDLSKDSKVKFELDKLMVVPGRYKLTMYCASNGIIQDYIRDLAFITIKDGNFFNLDQIHFDTKAFFFTDFNIKLSS